MDTIEIVVYVICAFMTLSVLLMGFILLSRSPYIFSVDKRKGCCMRKKKFIWQKEYKSEILCKLSEVEEAIRVSNGFSNKLCLKLKSGENIVIFEANHKDEFLAFDRQVNEINCFLDNSDRLCEIKQSFLFTGTVYLLVSSFGLFVLLYMIYNQLF